MEDIHDQEAMYRIAIDSQGVTSPQPEVKLPLNYYRFESRSNNMHKSYYRLSRNNQHRFGL